MLGYISIGCYDLRERALFSKVSLMQKLIDITVLAAKEAGITIAGILASNTLPDSIAAMFPPRLHIGQGERDLCEVQRLVREECHSSPSAEACIIFRPGCGWMNKARIRDFAEHVRECDAPYLLSLRKISHIENPFWNLNIAPREYYEGGAVWEPYHAKEMVQKASVKFPDLYKATLAQRSQDVDDFYAYDGALYACRPAPALTKEGKLVSPTVFKTCPDDDQGDTPLYEKLSIFDIDGFSKMDLSVLESLITLHSNEKKMA